MTWTQPNPLLRKISQPNPTHQPFKTDPTWQIGLDQVSFDRLVNWLHTLNLILSSSSSSFSFSFFFSFFFLQIVRGRFGAVLPNWLFGVLLLFGLWNFTVSAFASSLAIMEITLYFTLRLDAHVESALTSNLVGSKADIRFVSSSSRVHR